MDAYSKKILINFVPAFIFQSRRSPKRGHNFTTDQRSYQLKVKDIRNKFQEQNAGHEPKPLKPSERHLEPDLTSIASEYDLRLFREAQAAASERIVCIYLHCFLMAGITF